MLSSVTFLGVQGSDARRGTWPTQRAFPIHPACLPYLPSVPSLSIQHASKKMQFYLLLMVCI